MNRHYDRYLVKKYPKLFRDRYAHMSKTCMCWGFECGDGWFNLINTLCANIQWHIDQTRGSRANTLRYNRALKRWIEKQDDKGLINYFTTKKGVIMKEMLISTLSAENPQYRHVTEYCSQVIVDQVKEKFGTLRFYYHGGDSFVDGLVSMADSMSGNICEVCGDKGKVGGRGWVSTRCKKHRKN